MAWPSKLLQLLLSSLEAVVLDQLEVGGFSIAETRLGPHCVLRYKLREQ